MEDFKRLLGSKELIQVNYKGQEFLPYGVLDSHMHETNLREMIAESRIEKWTIEELCTSIQKHAKTTFAILILIGSPEAIVHFLAQDHFQDTPTDHKLPLRLDELHKLLGTAELAYRFYETQWKFLVPVFGKSLLPRVLEDPTILPIVERHNEEAAEGGFAFVDKIRIASNHFGFDLPGTEWVVQKRLRPTTMVKIDFERELRNLSMVKLLKHPCIVELLSCFMHRGEYYFIFPWAEHGSLEHLLSGKRGKIFADSEQTLLSIGGLCSAVSVVHEFAASDIQAIGCHHDIKTSNILIDGQKLVLADFGLSRFKATSQDSASYFRGGRGDYVAPECEDLHYDFSKHNVRRSSDVWSLGCIILEILVFEHGGAEAITSFRSERLFEVEQTTYSKFHRGTKHLNEAVRGRIQLLETQEVLLWRELAALVNEMLSLQPDARPKMAEVCARVRRSLIDHIAIQVEQRFDTKVLEYGQEVLSIERKRFESWHETVKGSNSSQLNIESFFTAEDHERFDGLIRILQQLRDLLRAASSAKEKNTETDLLLVRKANDCLRRALPPSLQGLALEEFQLRLQREIVQPQIKYIEDPQTFTKSEERKKDEIDKDWSLAFPIQRSELVEKKQCEKFHIGEYHQSQVLWEIKPANDYLYVPGYAQKLSARLSAICSLMNSAHELRVLACEGYFGDDSKGKSDIGLVYGFPDLDLSTSSVKKVMSASLHQIITNDPKGRDRPKLGDRFRLAATLARSVLAFHRTGWIQRSICAQNVVFFRPEDHSWRSHMNEPYFLGFLDSREIEPGAFTEGYWTLDSKYQHPDYTSANSTGFRSHYDYYNLGIVLVEIAYWSTIGYLHSQSSASKKDSQLDLKKFLLRDALPRIGQNMGVIYENAVRECLTWVPNDAEIKVDCSKEQCLRFRENVVDALDRCVA